VIKERNEKGQVVGYKTAGTASLKRAYSEVKRRASKRKIHFDLTYDQWKFFSIRHCFYCGAAPGNTKNRYKTLRLKKGDLVIPTNGIDRINSSIGYTFTNSLPCCTKCNFMKHTESMTEFLLRVKKIYENQKSYYNNIENK